MELHPEQEAFLFRRNQIGVLAALEPSRQFDRFRAGLEIRYKHLPGFNTGPEIQDKSGVAKLSCIIQQRKLTGVTNA